VEPQFRRKYDSVAGARLETVVTEWETPVITFVWHVGKVYFGGRWDCVPALHVVTIISVSD